MTKIAILIWIVLGSTLAGVAVIVITAVPSLFDKGMKIIPYGAGAGFLVAIPLSYLIAKRIAALTPSRA